MVDIGIFHKKNNTGKNPALTTVKVVEKYETQNNLLQGNMFMLAIWLECEKMKRYGSLSSPYNIHTSSSAFFCQQVSCQYWQLSNFFLGLRRPELLHLLSSGYRILETANWATMLNTETSKRFVAQMSSILTNYLYFTCEKLMTDSSLNSVIF